MEGTFCPNDLKIDMSSTYKVAQVEQSMNENQTLIALSDHRSDAGYVLSESIKLLLSRLLAESTLLP